jgi:cytochrome c55X
MALAGGVARAEPSIERQGELLHLLRHDCGSCHGMTLKGGLGPPLLAAGLEGLPAEGLVAIILDGVPGRPMPPWRGLLPETDAAWLVEQLQAGIPDAN